MYINLNWTAVNSSTKICYNKQLNNTHNLVVVHSI